MKRNKSNLYFVVIIIWQMALIDASLEETVNNLKSKIEIAYYEEIKDLPNHPNKLLIDVRRTEELVQTGEIPTSINIPLSMVHQELSVDVKAEDFKQKYGRNKPASDSPIIFSCRSGKRAQQAAEIAVQLGYTNVKNYKGSWLDWAELQKHNYQQD